MTEPTPTGASESAEVTTAEVKINPRLAYIEGLAGRLDDQRHQDLEATMAEDPGMKYLQTEREAEMTGANFEQGTMGSEPITSESQQPLPGNQDVLPEYIVRRDDGFFFKAKVDGEERLIPMDRALAQLQKEEAVEDRFRYVNQKINELTEQERLLTVKANSLQAQPAPAVKHPPSEQEDVDDDGRKEAKELVNKLFTANEDEAAVELARVLRKNRVPVAAPVDPEKLVVQTTDAVLNRIEQNNIQKDVKAGYSQFSQNYPEIVADPLLFKVADSMTDTIKAENPDWLPSQVMFEAGRRAREWKNGQKPASPETESEIDIRQMRKAQLKPMPPAASTRHVIPVEEAPQTPEQVFREMRMSRGQPV